MELLNENSPFQSVRVTVDFEFGRCDSCGSTNKIKGYTAHYICADGSQYAIASASTPEEAIKLAYAWACGYFDAKEKYEKEEEK